MIMQSAFFKLADIIPLADAVKYLKDAVEHSYGKKGQNIVDMNNAAIDKGIDAIVAVDVPASWAEAGDTAAQAATGNEFIDKLLVPMNKLEGDKLPVSAFADYADGTFPSGTAAYEKRGIAIDVPEWQMDTCIQCNQCAFVCPHAAIRPVLMTEEEAAKLRQLCRASRLSALKADVQHEHLPAGLHRLRQLRSGMPGSESQSSRYEAARYSA